MLDLLSILTSVALALVTVSLLFIYGMSSYTVFKKTRIPGPRPIPFLGNLLPMARRGFVYPLLEWKEKFGPVFGVYFGHQPVVVVSDLEMLKQIEVKDFSKFQNRWDIDLYPNPINKGIFFEKGANWKRIRSTISPTFSASKLKLMCHQINVCAEKLSQKLEEVTSRGQQVEIKDYLSSFAMDVILMTAFGKNLDSQKNASDPFVKNACNIFKDSVYTQPFVFLATLFPSMEKLGKKLGVSAWPKDAVNFIIKTVREIVEERRHEHESKSQDFLQLMLDAEMPDADDVDHHDANGNVDKNQKRLTEDEIIGQAFLFLIAGYETTASALQYMTYALATNPDIQDKVYEEIDTVLGDEEPSYENIIQMRYMEQVFNETLRMFPIVPITTREAMETMTINGYQIDKGTAVAVSIYTLHHDPMNFPNPEVFDPERFSQENKRKINPVAFHPFGYGPRICIGMRLALMEAKCAMVHMLRRVKLVQSEETEVPLKFDNNRIMKPARPIRLRIEPRTKA
ncbi:cytochrome P450 3A6-like [Haliotis rubra]|uniref:cytochrome P450 3A6-like n=1 Tax=Haliotis rubra TaxID=36100 RepID=UPI001EE5FAA7|nr:cytochrome P450 3A6-like [Haliotis rubra]XP_046574880.1 cytochrome P450 3A6-like [Haliotis rubra]